MFGVAKLAELPEAALSELVLERAVAAERARAELLEAVAAWDGKGAWRADGAANPRAWLSSRARMTREDARRVVRSARLLRAYARTEKALASGAVVVCQVDALARAEKGREALYEQHEEQLLDAAVSVAPRDFDRVARRWCAYADDTLARRDPYAVYERRHLHLSTTFGGAVAISGLLDPDAGARLQAALAAVDRPDPAGGVAPPRTFAQRQVDNLVALACGPRNNAGVVAQIDVVVDAGTAAGAPPRGLAARQRDIVGVGPIAASTLERLCCDAKLATIMKNGVKLDLGRSTRVVSRAQRRALRHRDGGCRFGDCDRSAGWCDAHHIEPWERGGRTDLDNLVLLCRHHHVLVHEGGWRLERDPVSGQITVCRPDDRAPPTAA